MDELIGQISYGNGLVDTFGQDIVQRALKLADGQPAEANLMPYIYRALEEAKNGNDAPETPCV